MTGKVQSAVDRLSYLSDNLTEISERTAADKTSMLIAREEHVRHMQLRLVQSHSHRLEIILTDRK